MIEKGRHLNIRKDLRFCKFCTDAIEDEKHFLISCPTFSTQREMLMIQIKEKLSNPFVFENMDDNKIFIFLLENMKSVSLVAKYLDHTLEIREFLLNKHKMQIWQMPKQQPGYSPLATMYTAIYRTYTYMLALSFIWIYFCYFVILRQYP